MEQLVPGNDFWYVWPVDIPAFSRLRILKVRRPKQYPGLPLPERSREQLPFAAARAESRAASFFRCPSGVEGSFLLPLPERSQGQLPFAAARAESRPASFCCCPSGVEASFLFPLPERSREQLPFAAARAEPRAASFCRCPSGVEGSFLFPLPERSRGQLPFSAARAESRAAQPKRAIAYYSPPGHHYSMSPHLRILAFTHSLTPPVSQTAHCTLHTAY